MIMFAEQIKRFDFPAIMLSCSCEHILMNVSQDMIEF